MKITVTVGRGVGATKLSAFDAALWDAGIGDYNLITLSSVVPVGCEVVEGRHVPLAGQVGWKLYCVLSVAHAPMLEQPGNAAWAGLGWAYRPQTGGIFIEEAGTTREHVVDRIQAAYTEMHKRRGDVGPLKTAIAQAPQAAPCSCAVVVAVYKSEAWV